MSSTLSGAVVRHPSEAKPTKILLRVLRQENPEAEPHWEEFRVPYQENLNVISALMHVQKDPVTLEGQTVRPPAWDAACLEEVCGSCTMNINGMIRQACTALIEDVAEIDGDAYRITLEP